jgi:uncharacterized protein (UPF0276 family)
MNTTPKLGIGIGWRPEIALAIERLPSIGFIEVTAENLAGASLPPPVQRLRQSGVKVVPHGISLSLGGAEPVDPKRVQHIDQIARRAESPLASEHIAFVRAGGIEIGHLTPLPRTRAALDVLVQNVGRAQQILSVPIALENVAALFDWPDAEMDDAEFVTRVIERTGAFLLLDVANLYANSRNLGVDPIRFLDRIPLDRIAYVHMGGGIEREGIYHDTHAHPVPTEAVQLLEELCARTSPGGVMLERDDDFPPEQELREEVARIGDAVARGSMRREAALVR